MAKQIRLVVHRLCLISTILFSTVGCDQVTKAVVRDTLPITGPLTYFHDSVTFQFAQNPGAFMNLGADLSVELRFWLFNVATAIILGLLAWLLFSSRPLKPLSLIGLALVLGGGIGNLIDRFLFGRVTDFVILGVGPFRTGIFNIADLAIVTGLAIVLLAGSNRFKLEHGSADT